MVFIPYKIFSISDGTVNLRLGARSIEDWIVRDLQFSYYESAIEITNYNGSIRFSTSEWRNLQTLFLRRMHSAIEAFDCQDAREWELTFNDITVEFPGSESSNQQSLSITDSADQTLLISFI